MFILERQRHSSKQQTWQQELEAEGSHTFKHKQKAEKPKWKW